MEDTGVVPTRLLAKGAKGVGIEIKKLASVTQGGASKSTIVDVLDSVGQYTSGVPGKLVAKGAKGFGTAIKKLSSVIQGGASKSTGGH